VEQARLHVICVGGNSEASFAGGPQSLRQLSNGTSGGRLRELLLDPLGTDRRKIDVSCTYYSWTGAPREDTWWIPIPVSHWFGADRIAKAENRAVASPKKKSALIVIGWSNGGDTAYNLAKKISSVDVLFTLDPVSRVTSAHWFPLMGTFPKPNGVQLWLHAYTSSVGIKKITNAGNIIAAVGGPWNDQPRADVDVKVSGNHGDTIVMLTSLTQSERYRKFLRSLIQDAR
jgi:hypothetical protein